MQVAAANARLGEGAVAGFDDTELTAEVIRSFDQTPDPRLKSILTQLVVSLHDFVRKTDLSFAEMGNRDRLPDPDRSGLHAHPAGIHPAVGRARRLHAGRCGQPSGTARRDANYCARTVLCR